MGEKKFRVNDLVKFNYSEVGEYVDENHTDRPLRNDEVVDLLNEQQATISALKDIFKDIIAYSKWDSGKPYCSLGMTVNKKTYYKIRKILNE